ncbi:hypothetical protein FB451DRAFT_1519179 [Mycena latifolia]|nr:hypothetical protein FB451DRAFT_1519179 [Mycena latifolia]
MPLTARAKCNRYLGLSAGFRTKADIGGACRLPGPYSWEEVVNISVSITFPPTSPPVYVRAVHAISLDLLEDGYATRGPTLLPPGARLIGVLVWTQREIITQVRWGISTPRTTAFTSEVTSLQPDPSNDTSGSNIATLTLLQPYYMASTLIQDTVDNTTLSGVATFGGFWTFLNGAFALVFGANVIYFAFGKWECSILYNGRRPLSALGVAHIFQKRALVRQWHEDFPAIHTEGGTPGLESAGIVAFIRERLVDLGEDPRASAAEHELADVEAQTTRAPIGALEGEYIDLQTTGEKDFEDFPIRTRKLEQALNSVYIRIVPQVTHFVADFDPITSSSTYGTAQDYFENNSHEGDVENQKFISSSSLILLPLAKKLAVTCFPSTVLPNAASTISSQPPPGFS